MRRLFKTPTLAKWYFATYEWQGKAHPPTLYLTFDDGPIPGLTEYVLDLLLEYKAKATFFCVGDNIRKHPAIFGRILAEGHQAANHTYHHLNGAKTPTQAYLQNVALCQALLPASPGKPLFRPPYGRLTLAQQKVLQIHYRLIMWDVLSYDFDAKLPPDACWVHSQRKSCPGSIVVFHDNHKAESSLRYALPRFLAHFSARSFQFAHL
ncbi:MAG: polysaccharide deacetylase family protein [Microscillaceae bacterium]|nr:polysaccharide deacetylase family protein [Microscillaceae bacterium]